MGLKIENKDKTENTGSSPKLAQSKSEYFTKTKTYKEKQWVYQRLNEIGISQKEQHKEYTKRINISILI